MLEAVSRPGGDDRGQAILAGLFSTVHERRASSAAGALLSSFGSLSAVLAASATAQARVLGGEPKLIRCLASMRAAMLHVLADDVRGTPVVATSESLLRYLAASMAHEPREHVRVLFLNAANRLIADEIVSSGSVRSVEFHPREIMRRALEVGATALVLVHNHPSGNPEPSSSDVRATRDVVEAGRTLGVAVHDHVVIARDGHASLRERGLL